MKRDISRARILVQVTIYRRLRIGRDSYLDQSEASDILYLIREYEFGRVPSNSSRKNGSENSQSHRRTLIDAYRILVHVAWQ